MRQLYVVSLICIRTSHKAIRSKLPHNKSKPFQEFQSNPADYRVVIRTSICSPIYHIHTYVHGPKNNHIQYHSEIWFHLLPWCHTLTYPVEYKSRNRHPRWAPCWPHETCYQECVFSCWLQFLCTLYILRVSYDIVWKTSLLLLLVYKLAWQAE